MPTSTRRDAVFLNQIRVIYINDVMIRISKTSWTRKLLKKVNMVSLMKPSTSPFCSIHEQDTPLQKKLFLLLSYLKCLYLASGFAIESYLPMYSQSTSVLEKKTWPVQNMHLGFTSDACSEQANVWFCISDNFNPYFAFECTHNCLMHLKVALSIAPIVNMVF